jgi:hypothetical protein
MTKLLDKLNYKGQNRIAVINAEPKYYRIISKELKNVQVDTEIDQRYPYEFMIIFTERMSEVELIAPDAIHNLLADGILWFCYPKKSSKKYSSDLERDKIWPVLNNSGFHGIRMVAIDEDWSAMRFRNVKYIKSVSGKYQNKSSCM